MAGASNTSADVSRAICPPSSAGSTLEHPWGFGYLRSRASVKALGERMARCTAAPTYARGSTLASFADALLLRSYDPAQSVHQRPHLAGLEP